MGWLFGWESRDRIVEHLVEPWQDERMVIRTVKHKVAREYGKYILWRVVEIKSKATGGYQNIIACYQLDRLNGRWGYKAGEESMGLYHHSCPVSFLKCAPCPNQWGAEWRKRVREYHNQ